MAKLFAAEISEDELLKKARQVWADINNTGNSYWNKDSDLWGDFKDIRVLGNIIDNPELLGEVDMLC